MIYLVLKFLMENLKTTKNDIASSNVSWNDSSGINKLYLRIMDSVILVKAGNKNLLKILSFSSFVEALI